MLLDINSDANMETWDFTMKTGNSVNDLLETETQLNNQSATTTPTIPVSDPPKTSPTPPPVAKTTPNNSEPETVQETKKGTKRTKAASTRKTKTKETKKSQAKTTKGRATNSKYKKRDTYSDEALSDSDHSEGEPKPSTKRSGQDSVNGKRKRGSKSNVYEEDESSNGRASKRKAKARKIGSYGYEENSDSRSGEETTAASSSNNNTATTKEPKEEEEVLSKSNNQPKQSPSSSSQGSTANPSTVTTPNSSTVSNSSNQNANGGTPALNGSTGVNNQYNNNAQYRQPNKPDDRVPISNMGPAASPSSSSSTGAPNTGHHNSNNVGQQGLSSSGGQPPNPGGYTMDTFHVSNNNVPTEYNMVNVSNASFAHSRQRRPMPVDRQPMVQGVPPGYPQGGPPMHGHLQSNNVHAPAHQSGGGGGGGGGYSQPPNQPMPSQNYGHHMYDSQGNTIATSPNGNGGGSVPNNPSASSSSSSSSSYGGSQPAAMIPQHVVFVPQNPNGNSNHMNQNGHYNPNTSATAAAAGQQQPPVSGQQGVPQNPPYNTRSRSQNSQAGVPNPVPSPNLDQPQGQRNYPPSGQPQYGKSQQGNYPNNTQDMYPVRNSGLNTSGSNWNNQPSGGYNAPNQPGVGSGGGAGGGGSGGVPPQMSSPSPSNQTGQPPNQNYIAPMNSHNGYGHHGGAPGGVGGGVRNVRTMAKYPTHGGDPSKPPSPAPGSGGATSSSSSSYPYNQGNQTLGEPVGYNIPKGNVPPGFSNGYPQSVNSPAQVSGVGVGGGGGGGGGGPRGRRRSNNC
eukprot:TRINITY_DN281_c2_g1_i5.p1 TRINITY_DN281_c2_g1~~TRINITY_DN281_c2_g1_i5.p1  ORF type:complete len:787 (+),score=291.99 TRINITY_DN281_c2_g1_i5:201-2561(+)